MRVEESDKRIEYIDKANQQIQFAERHEEILLELRGLLSEYVFAYYTNGIDEIEIRWWPIGSVEGKKVATINIKKETILLNDSVIFDKMKEWGEKHDYQKIVRDYTDDLSLKSKVCNVLIK